MCLSKSSVAEIELNRQKILSWNRLQFRIRHHFQKNNPLSYAYVSATSFHLSILNFHTYHIYNFEKIPDGRILLQD